MALCSEDQRLIVRRRFVQPRPSRSCLKNTLPVKPRSSSTEGAKAERGAGAPVPAPKVRKPIARGEAPGCRPIQDCPSAEGAKVRPDLCRPFRPRLLLFGVPRGAAALCPGLSPVGPSGLASLRFAPGYILSPLRGSRPLTLDHRRALPRFSAPYAKFPF